MSLLHKKGWNKLRLGRISIILNTISDVNLKIKVAKDLIKQIDKYIIKDGLNDVNIPTYDVKKKGTLHRNIFLLSKEKYLLFQNKEYLKNKINAFKPIEYRYQWLGTINQLEELFEILEKYDCIKKPIKKEDWLSNFLDKSNIPFNNNYITRITWYKSDVYLVRILEKLMTKTGTKMLINEKRNKWIQANKIFCKPGNEDFKDLAQSLNQCKVDGKLKSTKHDESLTIILKEIDSL